MANQTHLKQLQTDATRWNEWRKQNPEIHPDLTDLDFRPLRTRVANLVFGSKHDHTFDGYNFSNADLSRSYLGAHKVERMILTGAKLIECDLSNQNLSDMNLSDCNFTNANLSACVLRNSNLSRAVLRNTNLRFTVIADCNLNNANLSGSSVYGASVWATNLADATQDSIIITPQDSPQITVDNIGLAQFIYLILDNRELRNVIDTLTSKVVLILGRFTPDRKAVLDELKSRLRELNYVPVIFDFEKPSSRNFTETVKTLASLAKFVIADITDASSIGQELMAIVPTQPSVPIQPILQTGSGEYAMFPDFKHFPWVRRLIEYENEASSNYQLVAKLVDEVTSRQITYEVGRGAASQENPSK